MNEDILEMVLQIRFPCRAQNNDNSDPHKSIMLSKLCTLYQEWVRGMWLCETWHGFSMK